MKVLVSLPAIAAAFAVLAFAAVAGAQPARTSSSAVSPEARATRTADYSSQDLGGDQVIKFTGDELSAPPNGAYGGSIRPLPGSVRVGLIRARTNFISELLKSVEHL